MDPPCGGGGQPAGATAQAAADAGGDTGAPWPGHRQQRRPAAMAWGSGPLPPAGRNRDASPFLAERRY